MEFGDKVCASAGGGMVENYSSREKESSLWLEGKLHDVFLQGWLLNRLVFCFVFTRFIYFFLFFFRPPLEFLLREGWWTSKRKEATEGEDAPTSRAGLFLLSEASGEPFSTTVLRHQKPPLGIQTQRWANKEREARRRPCGAGVLKKKKKVSSKH